MSKGKDDWKHFEQRRKEAKKTGYGQPPTTAIPQIPRAQIGTGKANFGYDQKSDIYPQHGEYPPQSVPYSYTQGPQQASTSATWFSPPNQSHDPVIVDGRKVAQPRTESIRHQTSHLESDEIEAEWPVKKRKCRDVICLAIFAAFMCLMAGVAIFALLTGNYKRLDPLHKVEGCQSSLGEALERGFTPVFNELYESSRPSHAVLQPRADVSKNQTYDGFFDEVADNLKESWPNIVYMCLIALGLSILMTILLRVFAGIIIWAVVFLFVVVAVGLTVWIWVYFISIHDSPTGTFWEKNKKEVMLVCAILVSIVAILFLLVLLAMRRRIALVISLFQEAGKAVHAMPQVLIQPVWTFLCTALISAIFLSLAVLIETSRTNSDDGCKRPGFANISRYLNIFAYLWMVQFVVGCQHMVVAGAVAQWYFIRDKTRLGFPILTSFKNVVRYHLGSIAIGSLIIAILKFIRFILNQIRKRLSAINCCIKCLLCCCQCFFWCLETFLQFINRNAYIEIAIHGYAFCPAAKRAFNIISTHALSLTAINSIGDFVLFLGKLSVVVLSATCGYFIIRDDLDKTDSKMDVEWAVIFIGAYFSYFIANCFLSIYEMAMDTIFICFCEDSEMNDGVARPYYMSRGLMEFMKKNEKHEKKNKKRNKKSD